MRNHKTNLLTVLAIFPVFMTGCGSPSGDSHQTTNTDMATNHQGNPDLAMATNPDLAEQQGNCPCTIGSTMQADCRALISVCKDEAIDPAACPTACSCGFDMPDGQCPMGKSFKWTDELLKHQWGCTGSAGLITPKNIHESGGPFRVDIGSNWTNAAGRHWTCVDNICCQARSMAPNGPSYEMVFSDDGTTASVKKFDPGATKATPREVSNCWIAD